MLKDAEALLRLMERFEVVGYTDNSSLVKMWIVRDNRNGAFTNVVPFGDMEAARKCWALNIVAEQANTRNPSAGAQAPQ